MTYDTLMFKMKYFDIYYYFKVWGLESLFFYVFEICYTLICCSKNIS